MKTETQIKNKAKQMANDFYRDKDGVLDKKELLVDMFENMARFAGWKPQTAEQRSHENWRRFHAVAGE